MMSWHCSAVRDAASLEPIFMPAALERRDIRLMR
jgi:hypothetical protein